MYRRNVWLPAAAAVLALAVACGRTPNTPVEPSGSTPSDSTAAPDGSTLKVTAPVAQSPINGAQPDSTLTLVAGASTVKFTTAALNYRFEIFNAAKSKVCDSGLVAPSGSTVSFTPSNCTLDFDANHTWRVRAEFQGAVGPWSPDASFRSPVGGFIKGNELFDPLTNGPSSIISNSNDVTWLPGIGVRLNSRDSYVEWRLPTPCVECEYSAMMTNIGNGSEEWKTKVMSMLQGDGVNTTENAYRVTIDKRTTWVDQGSRIRYTMRSRGEDSGEPRGGFQNWNRSFAYFWKFEWRGGLSRLRVFENGKNGRQMEDLSIDYKAPYAPNPHLIRLGSVGGRAEPETNPGTIVWNVWVSPNPRPNLPGDK